MAIAEMASYFDEVRHSLSRAQDAAEKALTDEAAALHEKAFEANKRLKEDIRDHKEQLACLKQNLDALSTENMKLRRLQIERDLPRSPCVDEGEDVVDADNAVALSPESSPERDDRGRDRPRQHQTARPHTENSENNAREDASGLAAPSPSPPAHEHQGGARAVTEGPVSSRFLRSRSLSPVGARSCSPPGRRPPPDERRQPRASSGRAAAVDGDGEGRGGPPLERQGGSGSRGHRRSPSSRGGSLHSPRSRGGSVARAPQPRQPSAGWQEGAGGRSPELRRERERSRSVGPVNVRSRSRSHRALSDSRRPGFDDRDQRHERSPPWDDGREQRRERRMSPLRSPLRPDLAALDGWRSPIRPNGWGNRGDSRARSTSRAIRRPPPGQKRDRDPPPRRADQLCIPWATGKCRKGDACKDGHPPPEEAKRILEIIQRKPCRFGKECRRADCIFTHREDKELQRHNTR